MSETNSKTIATYNEHIQDYIDNTPSEVDEASKIWLEESLKDLSKSAHILEIGSGIGHDAAFVESKGYKVERSDASSGFVEFLKQQGADARLFNVLTEEIKGTYDLIFADAVLQHFTKDEIEVVLRNITDGLNQTGIFAFSLRIGDREGWSDEKLNAPRYFRYWLREEMEELVYRVGFKYIKATDDHRQGSSWLHLIAYK